MSAKNPNVKAKRTGRGLRVTRKASKVRRKKRKSSCASADETTFRCSRAKKIRIDACNATDEATCHNVFNGSVLGARFVEEADPNPDSLKSRENGRSTSKTKPNADVSSKCWIDALPQELLLKIFSYLPLGLLLHTIPQVCKKWETLALDWTLWKAVENLTIKNMVISTRKLRTLLRTIPKLKKLELILRNDTEELLRELMKTHHGLEVLKLDRCYRSTLQMNILSQTVTSILEFCPRLKTIMLTDTYFHSKAFYRSLAKKFRNIERINVTCTTKSEMDVFVENLKESVPEVEFQRVPMMGRAEGKQIYWGPILGLVIRPIPTSPFHRQYTPDNYPTYAF